MVEFNDVAKQIIKEHNPNWPQISDHLLRIVKNGGSESQTIH